MSVPRFQLVVFAVVLAASLVSYVLFVSVFSSTSLVSPVLAKGNDLERVEDFSGVSLFFLSSGAVCTLCDRTSSRIVRVVWLQKIPDPASSNRQCVFHLICEEAWLHCRACHGLLPGDLLGR